jgi:hypothetical protein
LRSRSFEASRVQGRFSALPRIVARCQGRSSASFFSSDGVFKGEAAEATAQARANQVLPVFMSFADQNSSRKCLKYTGCFIRILATYARKTDSCLAKALGFKMQIMIQWKRSLNVF